MAITRVLRAPMSFFDTTPLGRITNRFSKDIDVMDNTLTDAIRMYFLTLAMIISVFILIIAYYYYYAIALGPLFILFMFSAAFYRSSAREVKRHEAVLRSTVFARFGEAVMGTATIRAYGLQNQFSRTVREAIDDMNSAYYLTFANQRWLSVRLDVVGILLVFTTGILVVTSRFNVNPSIAGLVLSYILTIVQMIQFTVRQLAEVENNMNSTERIYHYGTQLEEEAALHTDVQVRPTWPEHGEIIFENVEMRYRDGLPLVLKGLSMHVRAGERIGVVGRTGAGKSSIMSALFRLQELAGGSITIDGLDISKIGLQNLRENLAIIPQDPTLFKGTVSSVSFLLPLHTANIVRRFEATLILSTRRPTLSCGPPCVKPIWFRMTQKWVTRPDAFTSTPSLRRKDSTSLLASVNCSLLPVHSFVARRSLSVTKQLPVSISRQIRRFSKRS
jgi:ATP-binding cassette subfamily C (CFTR/MRP) protein 1